jgi:hypothetical protein
MDMPAVVLFPLFIAFLLRAPMEASNSSPEYVIPDNSEQARDESHGAFSRMSFFAGISRDLYSSDKEHAWDQHYATTITIYRGRADERILYYGCAELVADASNSIHFSPNSVFYDNLLLYSRPLGGGRLGIGYFQRCKHHVDTTGRLWLYNGPYFDARCRAGGSGSNYSLDAFLLPVIYAEDLRIKSQPRLIAGIEGKAEKAGYWLKIAPVFTLTGSTGQERYLVFRDTPREGGETGQWRLNMQAGRSWPVHNTSLSAYLEYEDTDDAGISLRAGRTRLFALGFRIGKL